MTWHLGRQGPTSSHSLACATRRQRGTCSEGAHTIAAGSAGIYLQPQPGKLGGCLTGFLACVALGYKCWILPQKVLAPAGIACTVGCVTMCYPETAHTMAARNWSRELTLPKWKWMLSPCILCASRMRCRARPGRVNFCQHSGLLPCASNLPLAALMLTPARERRRLSRGAAAAPGAATTARLGVWCILQRCT